MTVNQAEGGGSQGGDDEDEKVRGQEAEMGKGRACQARNHSLVTSVVSPARAG